VTKELAPALDRALADLPRPPTRGEQEAQALSCLTADNLLALSDLVHLLQRALKYRTQMGFRYPQRWQMAIDEKWGLNKVVNGADAALMCGLGVVRRVLQGETDIYHPKEPPEDLHLRVCAACEVSHYPRAIWRRFDLGGHEKYFLAKLSLSIDYLFRPSGLRAQFHEVGHMICDLLVAEGCPKQKAGLDHCSFVCYRRTPSDTEAEEKPEEKLDARRYREMQAKRETEAKRFKEIFAEMVSLCFLYGTKPHEARTYFRSYVGNYYLEPVSVRKDPRETLLFMTEVLIRGFLAIDPFAQAYGPETARAGVYLYDVGKHPDYELTSSDLAAAKERFRAAIRDAGPFFPEFRRLCAERSEGERYVLERFERVFREAYGRVTCMSHAVKTIVTGICHDTERNRNLGIDPPEEDASWLLASIEEGYRSGAPLVRVLYEHPKVHQEPNRAKSPEEHGRLDSLFLITRVLRAHLAFSYGPGAVDLEKELTLVRDPGTGKVLEKYEPDFGQTCNGFNRWLLDRSYNGFVSADLVARRERMQRRVVVLKTLWDVSANLRARRLKKLLEWAGLGS